jgi:hypothetical protein
MPSQKYGGPDTSADHRTPAYGLQAGHKRPPGYRDWTVDHAGWVVILMSPEEQQFYGRTLEEALAWRLVWLMAPELGIGPCVVCAVVLAYRGVHTAALRLAQAVAIPSIAHSAQMMQAAPSPQRETHSASFAQSTHVAPVEQ